MQKKRQIGPFRASKESFVPHMRRGQVCRESFVPKRQGVVVVGRIMPCSGVVLVPVGGLWRRPGAAHAHCGRALRAPGVLHAGGGGGFALHDALLRRVAGVSDPRVVQFPPTGGGADAVRGCVATKVQTHWVKNGEKSLLWLNESTFWRIRPLAWFVAHTRTLYREREPAISHVIPRRPLQRLNYHHWNCNVCRLSQKVTALNYVRLLEEATPDICHGTTCIKGHFRPH